MRSNDLGETIVVFLLIVPWMYGVGTFIVWAYNNLPFELVWK